MKYWEYRELKETIREAYLDLLDQGDTPEHSLARVFEDFYFYPEESNKVENLITIIESIKMRIQFLGFLTFGIIELLQKQIIEVSDELLNKELTADEITSLKSDLDQVLKQIKTADIKKKK